MKPPKWFTERLAAEGGRVLEHETDGGQVINKLARQILATDPGFARELVAEFVRHRLRRWTAQHEPASGQLDMFPELPRRLEISPGRFTGQAEMTRKDWDAALRQAQTKADNAGGHYDAVRRAYDIVRPLLTDDSMTTATVLADHPDAAAGGQ